MKWVQSALVAAAVLVVLRSTLIMMGVDDASSSLQKIAIVTIAAYAANRFYKRKN